MNKPFIKNSNGLPYSHENGRYMSIFPNRSERRRKDPLERDGGLYIGKVHGKITAYRVKYQKVDGKTIIHYLNK